MHPHLCRFIVVLAVAAAPALPALRLSAAEPPGAGSSAGERATHLHQARLDKLGARLALTDAQKASIGPILQQEAADLMAVRNDASLGRRQKLQKTRDIVRAASEQIRALLTPEQQPKYDELVEQGRQRLRERIRQRGAPLATPPS